VDNYLQKNPKNTTALHLKALLLERLGHLSLALEAVLLCNSLLEEAYEESEVAEVAWRYCIAQATCARLHLKREGVSESLEAFETVLSLVPDSHEGRKGQIKMQSILGMAIAWAKQGSEVEAFEMVEKASKLAQKIGVYQSSVDVVGSQVGWTLGKQDLAQSFLLNRPVFSRSKET
jgi:superkiller protein 3